MEHKLIFKAIIGSQAQGTSTPESDFDYKGVYLQEIDDLISYGYEGFVKLSKDESYYEIRRFLDLLSVANPESLELLFSPDDCILINSPQFMLLQKHKNEFLTKKCAKTFANYAYNQIKKSKGTNKKINWESEKITRKTPLDFCYIQIDGKTLPLNIFLNKNNMKQEFCGLANLEHFRDCYVLYYGSDLNFKGIIGENSNELRLSSIPKDIANEQTPLVLYYNKDGYTTHCKDYKSYLEWLENRNINRFHTNISHGQIYDSKNLSHCRRLIDIALEIGRTGTFSVKRPNVDYLLEIKRGDTPLDKIIEEAERDIKLLDEIYKNSNLPDDVNPLFVKDLLLQIRKMKEPNRCVGVVCKNNNDFLLWKRKMGFDNIRGSQNSFNIDNEHFFKISNISDICSKRIDRIITTDGGKELKDYQNIMTLLKQSFYDIHPIIEHNDLEPLNIGQVVSQEHQELDDKNF